MGKTHTRKFDVQIRGEWAECLESEFGEGAFSLFLREQEHTNHLFLPSFRCCDESRRTPHLLPQQLRRGQLQTEAIAVLVYTRLYSNHLRDPLQ